MLVHTELLTTEQLINYVKQLVRLTDHTTAKDNQEFHELLRGMPNLYFDEWDPTVAYQTGDCFLWKGTKYLTIKDTPVNSANTPDLAIMRQYSLAYQGMYACLWAFKEPVQEGMLRYPYNSTDIYRAKASVPSEQNTAPPEENPTLWELVPQEESVV